MIDIAGSARWLFTAPVGVPYVIVAASAWYFHDSLTEVKDDIHILRTEFRQELSTTKMELREEMQALRQEVKQDIQELTQDIRELRQVLNLMIENSRSSTQTEN